MSQEKKKFQSTTENNYLNTFSKLTMTLIYVHVFAVVWRIGSYQL